MDGVLVDSAAAHLCSWQLLAQECDGVVTQERFAETFGRQNCDIIPMLFGEVPDPRIQTLADRKEKIYRELIQGHTPIVEGAVDWSEAVLSVVEG